MKNGNRRIIIALYTKNKKNLYPGNIQAQKSPSFFNEGLPKKATTYSPTMQYHRR